MDQLLKNERAAIRVAIKKKLNDTTPDDTLRALMCALYGHPPVVSMCFGQVTCERCGGVVGDTLTSSFDTSRTAIVGHDCKRCRAIVAGLTLEQRLGTNTTLTREE